MVKSRPMIGKENIINYLDFKYLARLEENKWVRSINARIDGSLNIHLKR